MFKAQRIPKPTPDLRSALWRWNVGVVVVHWTSFVALLVIGLVRLSQARQVAVWVDLNGVIQPLGSYPIFATLVPFPFITGLFHVLAAAGVDRYYEGVLGERGKGVNRLRWIEYAITNGLMTFSLCMLSGAGNLLLALVCVLANFSMQYHGLLFERSNARDWAALWMGFVPWVAIWGVVVTYYAGSLALASPPLYDGFAVFGSLAWSLGFVIPLVWRGLQPEQNARVWYAEERAYILLSLTAKLYLDWTVTIGNLVAP